jgi:gluconokinase
MNCPCSALTKAGGLKYFPRMLSKIRLHARGELRPDFHANLGTGADGWCCGFLRINYEELKQRVLAGGTDEEVLEWCFAQGHRLGEIDLMVWNSFVAKLGWNDFASKRLRHYKAEGGLADRDDIQTMPEYFDADEGRRDAGGSSRMAEGGP